MAKIRNYLLVVLMAILGLVLVGCDNGPVELPAPTELTINFDIYDGTENDPYVLVGNQMYLSAEVNAGADPSVTWTADTNGKAEMTEEDGSAVITGISGGNITVTCTSTKDATISQTVTIEVVPSNDSNAVLTDAINEIKSQLPVYVDKNFDLPKLGNENVKLTYLSKYKEVWADGVFKYVYEGLDIDYQFYARLAYRGAEVETILNVRVVSDVNDNAFLSIEKAQKIVDEFMSKYTTNDEGRVLNEQSEGVVTEAEWNQTDYPALLLPTSTTAEQTGVAIRIYWEAANVAGGTLNLKKYEQAGVEPLYYVTYEKAKLDTVHQLTCFFQLDSKLVKSVYNVTCDGYDPEEVVAYFVENGLALASPYTLTKSFVSVEALDTTKKFDKISVEYSVEDAEIVKLTEVKKTDSTGKQYVSGYRIQGLKNGETNLIATFYYGKTAIESEVDVLDEQGNPVVDPTTGEVLKETVVTYSYSYKYEYKIPFTVAR